jgi:hypothetical protein
MTTDAMLIIVNMKTFGQLKSATRLSSGPPTGRIQKGIVHLEHVPFVRFNFDHSVFAPGHFGSQMHHDNLLDNMVQNVI